MGTGAKGRGRAAAVLTILGILALVAALALYVYNYIDSERAGAASDAALAALVEQIADADARDPVEDPADVPDEDGRKDVASEDALAKMATIAVDGEEYIGFLTINTIGLELPVMASWDYDKLAVSACRYSGSVQGNDLVIAAHNYRRHFGKLNDVSIGDEVLFCDVSGVMTCYEVVAVEAVEAFAIEQMTAGDYDLSLFTCTFDGQARLTVRCDRS